MPEKGCVTKKIHRFRIDSHQFRQEGLPNPTLEVRWILVLGFLEGFVGQFELTERK
jgi:hypothetical protein